MSLSHPAKYVPQSSSQSVCLTSGCLRRGTGRTTQSPVRSDVQLFHAWTWIQSAQYPYSFMPLYSNFWLRLQRQVGGQEWVTGDSCCCCCTGNRCKQTRLAAETTGFSRRTTPNYTVSYGVTVKCKQRCVWLWAVNRGCKLRRASVNYGLCKL